MLYAASCLPLSFYVVRVHGRGLEHGAYSHPLRVTVWSPLTFRGRGTWAWTRT